MTNLSDLIYFAEQTYAKDNIFQCFGNYVRYPHKDDVLPNRHGLCYLSAAYYGATGQFLPNTDGKDVDLAKWKVKEAFGISFNVIHYIMELNDTHRLKWQHISERLRRELNETIR